MKSPAFQFYPDSWLSSTDISLMTPAEEGAYIRLLCHSWLQPDCGLPADDAALSVLSRLGAKWTKSAAIIRRKFTERDGRLYNERLLAEREKQREWAEKSSLGGKRGAMTRWGSKQSSHDEGGYQMVTECLKPKHDIPSPILFPSSVIGGDVKGSVVCEPEAAPPPPPTPQEEAWRPNRWDEFRQAYPVQVGVEEGCRAYVGRIATDGAHYELMSGLSLHMASAKWRDKDTGELKLEYIPAMDKFISRGIYLDHPPPWKPPAKRERPMSRIEEMVRRA